MTRSTIYNVSFLGQGVVVESGRFRRKRMYGVADSELASRISILQPQVDECTVSQWHFQTLLMCRQIHNDAASTVLLVFCMKIFSKSDCQCDKSEHNAYSTMLCAGVESRWEQQLRRYENEAKFVQRITSVWLEAYCDSDKLRIHTDKTRY